MKFFLIKNWQIIILLALGFCTKEVIATNLSSNNISSSLLGIKRILNNLDGLYIGLNGGYSWGQSRTTTSTFVPPPTDFIRYYFVQSDVQQINDKGIINLLLNGFIGGGQIGYDHNLNSNFILGLETDFDSLNSSKANTQNITYISSPSFAFKLYTQTKTNWLFTLRPRLSYVFHNTKIYATGGLGVLQFKTLHTFTDNVNDTGVSSGINASSNQTKSQAGGVVGTGIERAFSKNISIKIEYLYGTFNRIVSYNEPKFNPAYLAVAATAFPPLGASSPFKNSANFSTNILRAGFNYKFT